MKRLKKELEDSLKKALKVLPAIKKSEENYKASCKKERRMDYSFQTKHRAANTSESSAQENVVTSRACSVSVFYGSPRSLRLPSTF